jgi:hypothetical protein
MKNIKDTDLNRYVTKHTPNLFHILVKQTLKRTMFARFSLFFTLIFSISLFSQELTYFYPKHKTGMHSIETPIILKFAQPVVFKNLEERVSIVGEKSGKHKFRYSISNDQRTVTIYTLEPFALGEKVTTKVFDKSLEFTTSNVSPSEQKILFASLFSKSFSENFEQNFVDGNTKSSEKILADTVPPDFPPVIINSVRNPAPGYIYIANFGMGSERSYLMILDNDGKPIKYKKVPLPGFDFKMQPSGLITNAHIITSHIPQGWGWAEAFMEVMNENLDVIDTVQCKGGYIADFHDFKILPNGHYLLISYDPQPIDMSQVVPDGDPNAIVLGSIIQELDADKNVVFQWRSWDHIPLEDSYAPLTGIAVDPVHINAVELDYDGNLLISSRHLSEITKISRETGEIIWRLGGKKNMFTFINEHEENAPTYFSYQHDIRRQPNGNITLYDNGNQHPTPYSRAVEYKLDETNMTAELVWEYRNNPDIYGETMGSTQRLPNGNTVIGWGGVTQGHIRIVTEVNPQGEVEFELSFPKGVSFQTTSYRAYRFPYPPNRPDVVVTKNEISLIVTPGQTPNDSLHFNVGNENTGVCIVFSQLSDVSPSKISVEKYSYAPLYPRFKGVTPLVNIYKIMISSENIEQFSGKIVLDLKQFPMLLHRRNLAIWRRTTPEQPFEQLPSTYDSINAILSAQINSLDGEYIIATADFDKPPAPPILTHPLNNSILNSQKEIIFQWTPRNVVTSSEILIAKDSVFVYIVLNTNGLKENIFKMLKLYPGTYYWKVRCTNSFGQSDWSQPFSFEVKDPFIRILSPKANDMWIKERNFTIEWEHNLDPDFMITLYKGSTPVFNIIDSIYSVYGKFVWNTPNIIEPSDNYKIRITSLKDYKIFAESGTFSIQEPNSVEENTDGFAVYPNPANGTLFIESHSEWIKSYKMLDALGRKIIEGETNALNNMSFRINVDNLAPGVYIIIVETTRHRFIKQVIIANY